MENEAHTFTKKDLAKRLDISVRTLLNYANKLDDKQARTLYFSRRIFSEQQMNYLITKINNQYLP